MEMDTPRLASQASHGVSMSISALVISKLATVASIFIVLRVMYNLIGPRDIEYGSTWSDLIGRVNIHPTFGNM